MVCGSFAEEEGDMYTIEKHEECLLVRFDEDFDYNMVQTIIHHVTSIKEYPSTNDIWLIGKYRADIRLGELETLMREFQCRCPRDASRTKTAIVVEPGMTESIIQLWMNATRKRVSFDMCIFNTLREAQAWLEIPESMSA